MEFIDIVLDLAADLQRYLDGTIGEETVLERYFTGPIDERLKRIKENIGQYIDDYERRRDDEEFRAMQEEEMRKLIHLLRLGKTEQAGKINFLYEGEIEY